MRHLYVPWRPRADADAIVRQAETFCQEYAAQGLDLTLRALYYRFARVASRWDEVAAILGTEQE